MKKYYVCCRENGDKIELVDSIGEGLALIEKYEESDKVEGIYEENFYEVKEFSEY